MIQIGKIWKLSSIGKVFADMRKRWRNFEVKRSQVKVTVNQYILLANTSAIRTHLRLVAAAWLCHCSEYCGTTWL